jgi:bacterioferritin-associated ferredoxin
MIICVCRNLNSKKVTSAIEGGARTPACVMAQHGTRFNCGKCREHMSEMIEKVSRTDEASPAGMMAAE